MIISNYWYISLYKQIVIIIKKLGKKKNTLIESINFWLSFCKFLDLKLILSVSSVLVLVWKVVFFSLFLSSQIEEEKDISGVASDILSSVWD